MTLCHKISVPKRSKRVISRVLSLKTYYANRLHKHSFCNYQQNRTNKFPIYITVNIIINRELIKPFRLYDIFSQNGNFFTEYYRKNKPSSPYRRHFKQQSTIIFNRIVI